MPTLKTLQLDLREVTTDLLGAGGSAWMVTVSLAYDRDVNYTTGRVPAGVEFFRSALSLADDVRVPVIPSDDPDVTESSRGFGIRVTLVLSPRHSGRGSGGRKEWLVTVPSSAPSVVRLSTLSPAETVPPQWVSASDMRESAAAAATSATAAAAAARDAANLVGAPAAAAIDTWLLGNSTTTGRALMKAADAAAGRSALGMSDTLTRLGSAEGTIASSVTRLATLEGQHRRGTGSPEGTVSAPVGTYYTDTDTSRTDVLWVKVTGTGNTGWKVVYGDTGIRNLDSSLNSPFTNVDGGQGLRLQRIGSTVYLFLGIRTTAATSGAVDIVNIPDGFRPTSFALLPSHQGNPLDLVLNGGGVLRVGSALASGATVRTLATWPTGNNWPA